MDIGTRTVGTVVVVSLVGDLDSATAPEVQDELHSLVEPDGQVLVDMSGVPYMSSAGLRTMLLLYRQAQSVDTTVGLVGVAADLRNMMAATGFLGYFTVSDTVADGLRDIRAAVPGARS